MQLATIFRGMSRNDARIVRRDALLGWLVALPLLNALILRWGAPFIAARLAAGIDLTPYYPLMVSYALLQMTPVLMGTVIGFLLLDERDDNTLQALLVTPAPLNAYLAYRVAMPTLLSMALTLIGVPLANLTSVPFWALVPVTLAAGLLAPIIGLIFAAYAENKVQGFAVLKVIGVLVLTQIAAYFIPLPWQYLVGLVFPPYWAARAFWSIDAAGAPAFWIFLALGVATQGGLLLFLLRRFHRTAYQ